MTAVAAVSVALCVTVAPWARPVVGLGNSPRPSVVTAPAAAVAEVLVHSLVATGDPVDAGSCGAASEPVVATHPSRPHTIAVAYQRFSPDECLAAPGIKISHDGGRTWREVTRYPWWGSGRGPGLHAAIAWGPGPTSSARLYWVDTTTTGHDGLSIGIAWSDDEGASWSRLYVEHSTPAWVGGFPDITVDRDPKSPNVGAVYVAYNWLGHPGGGPGLHLLASGDAGRSWHAVEIPPVPGPAGFGVAWRIDDRVRTAPDGSAYVAFYQADLRSWDSERIFSLGPWGNVGRVGFGVARVSFDRTSGTFRLWPAVLATTDAPNGYTAYGAAAPGTSDILVDPAWSMSLDVDPSSGRVLLAVGDYQRHGEGTAPLGTIRVGRSDDRGRTWRWVVLPALPPVDGSPQSSFRPSLVALDGTVFVGLRGITDRAPVPTVGVACSLSDDGGLTFSHPVAITRVRWAAAVVAPATNGMGLRERADRTADDRVFYAWSDARPAASNPRTVGPVVVTGAVILVADPDRPP